MDFEDYQRLAAQTDRIDAAHGLIVSLLGLGGEAGSLLTEYKKHLRDRAAHARFEATMAEELGDVLWYVASIATHMNLDLADIALHNIAKTQERWGVDGGAQVGLGLDPALPDDAFPVEEQLPRSFAIRFEETVEEGRRRVRVYEGETAVGDPLTDNAYDDDGYRYHDVFHLSYAVFLGWSPVLRKLLPRKRRSNPVTDEVEDGGRAQVIEEGVAAYVFEYARNHASLDGIAVLDYGLLRTVKSLTGGLEVSRCSFRDWERAILAGFDVWRGLVRQGSGVVVCDLRARTLTLTCVPAG